MNPPSTVASHIVSADIVLERRFFLSCSVFQLSEKHRNKQGVICTLVLQRKTFLFSSIVSLFFCLITFDTIMLMHFVIFLQDLKEDVALLDPQIDEFLKNSDTLLDYTDLPDEDHGIVERESELLEKRWNKVKNDANSRELRFVNTIKLNLSERAGGQSLSALVRLNPSSASPHRII